MDKRHQECLTRSLAHTEHRDHGLTHEAPRADADCSLACRGPTAGQSELGESRASCSVLREPQGEIPSGHSPFLSEAGVRDNASRRCAACTLTVYRDDRVEVASSQVSPHTADW